MIQCDVVISQMKEYYIIFQCRCGCSVWSQMIFITCGFHRFMLHSTWKIFFFHVMSCDSFCPTFISLHTNLTLKRSQDVVCLLGALKGQEGDKRSTDEALQEQPNKLPLQSQCRVHHRGGSIQSCVSAGTMISSGQAKDFRPKEPDRAFRLKLIVQGDFWLASLDLSWEHHTLPWCISPTHSTKHDSDFHWSVWWIALPPPPPTSLVFSLAGLLHPAASRQHKIYHQ